MEFLGSKNSKGRASRAAMEAVAAEDSGLFPWPFLPAAKGGSGHGGSRMG